jgi:hypothetical protein
MMLAAACLVMGLLYGGPTGADQDIKEIRVRPSACHITASISSEGLLILQDSHLTAMIPVPSKPGWSRFFYAMGEMTAYIEGRPVAVYVEFIEKVPTHGPR